MKQTTVAVLAAAWGLVVASTGPAQQVQVPAKIRISGTIYIQGEGVLAGDIYTKKIAKARLTTKDFLNLCAAALGREPFPAGSYLEAYPDETIPGLRVEVRYGGEFLADVTPYFRVGTDEDSSLEQVVRNELTSKETRKMIFPISIGLGGEDQLVHLDLSGTAFENSRAGAVSGGVQNVRISTTAKVSGKGTLLDTPEEARAAFVGKITAKGKINVPTADGDDFNDNTKNTAKWGPDFTFGECALAEVHQRLEFTATGTSTDGDVAGWMWRSAFGGASDLTVQVDVEVPEFNITGTNQWVAFGLIMGREVGVEQVTAALGQRTQIDETSGEPVNYRYVDSSVTVPGNTTQNVHTQVPWTTVSLRLSWNAAARSMQMQYDEDGPANGTQWLTLRTWQLADYGWTDYSTMKVGLFGNSMGLPVVSPTVLSGDNFRIGAAR